MSNETPGELEIKALWKKHRGPNLTDTSHRLHCFESGFRAGRAAGIEEAARVADPRSGDGKYGYTITDFRKLAAAIRALAEKEKP